MTIKKPKSFDILNRFIRKTRMKTSISNEALTQFRAEKIAFPPKTDIRTDGRTLVIIE